MKYPLQKSILGISIFLVLGYGISSAWTGLIASPGDVITAAKWNEMINKILPLYSTGGLSGNVGVGDSSPDHKLDVAGNIGLNTSSYINFGDTTGNTGYGFRDNAGTIQFKNSAGSWINIPSSIGAGDDLGNHTAIQNIALDTFWLSGDGDDEGISIDTNGNVGIGTLTPGTSFDVRGTSGSMRLSSSGANDTLFTINGGSGDRDPYLLFQQNGVNKWAFTMDIDANDDFSFYSYTGTPGTRMLIQEDTGNIGIGNTLPNTKLDISGDISLRLGTDYTTTGLANNVSLGGGTVSTVRYNGTNTGGLTGIAGGQNGKILIIHNASNFTFTLTHDDALSFAANRIYTANGRDLNLKTNTSVILSYDSTALKWRVLDSTPQSYIYRLTGAQTRNVNTYAAVPGLTSGTLPVGAYKFKFIGKFQSNLATSGAGFSLVQNTAVLTNYVAQMKTQQTQAAAGAINYEFSIVLPTAPAHFSPSVALVNTDYYATIEGTFEVTTSGTVEIQMRPETNAVLLTLQAGSYLEIEPLY